MRLQEAANRDSRKVVFKKGHAGEMPHYELPDDQLTHGASLANRRIWVNTKATGAIERVFCCRNGMSLLGSIAFTYTMQRPTLIGLAPQPEGVKAKAGGHYLLTPEDVGVFGLFPLIQKHSYDLTGELHVEETVLVPKLDHDDPPVVLQHIEVTNLSASEVTVFVTAHVDTRGDMPDDVELRFDEDLCALVIQNKSWPDCCRIVGAAGCGVTFESSQDAAEAYAALVSQPQSERPVGQGGPLARLRKPLTIRPGETAQTTFKAAISDNGMEDAKKWYQVSDDFRKQHKHSDQKLRPIASMSSVETPDPIINQGVFWAKINMLRVIADYPEGPAFTNEPGKSSNVVGRDVAWFVYGCDYVLPELSKKMLLKFAEKQYENGKIPEYYSALDGRVEDYGLSMNDGTPLFVMACGHHYVATHDRSFLNSVYESARRASDYILSQQDERGLVIANGNGHEVWGIASWRNVIPDYQILGAVTEINAECVAALREVAKLAAAFGKSDDAARFDKAADDLREAINRHLLDPQDGLYYLNIDPAGLPHTDVTADEVFPVLFDVAPADVAIRIVGRLRGDDFMTAAGLRTVSRNSPDYEPTSLVGLKGGVWPGVAFWYAFAASRTNPEFMIQALHASYLQYLLDPLKNNTVPGQFSEWFDGESLVNRGMRLSPWEPPRLLWAAVEGMCGAKAKLEGGYTVNPIRPWNWKWMALRRVPCAEGFLTYFATFEGKDVRIYSNMEVDTSYELEVAGEDVTNKVKIADYRVRRAAFMDKGNVTLCLGTETEAYVTAGISLGDLLEPEKQYALRVYSTATGWVESGTSSGADLSDIAISIEDGDFRVLKIVGS